MIAAVEWRSREEPGGQVEEPGGQAERRSQSMHCNGVTCREAAVIRAVLGNTTNTHVCPDVQSAW